MKIIGLFVYVMLISMQIVIPQEINEYHSEFLSQRGKFFGKKPPIETSEVFMDGIISNIGEAEMCAAFSDEGTRFYFNALYDGYWTIFESKMVNKKWTKPSPINFTNGFTDRDFTISPDGKQLYFGSDRPRFKGGEKLKSLDIYVSEKTKSGTWSEPQNLGEAINTDYFENYPSVDAIGNLYFFSSRKEGMGGCEIYLSKFVEGKYQTSELLSSSINSEQHDWDSFIAPNGSYIIFSSKDREDTIGLQDLYISFKDKSGKWTKAVNMGPKINSTSDEICPSVSANGECLFFTSRRRGKADIYWINAGIIETLKPNFLK